MNFRNWILLAFFLPISHWALSQQLDIQVPWEFDSEDGRPFWTGGTISSFKGTPYYIKQIKLSGPSSVTAYINNINSKKVGVRESWDIVPPEDFNVETYVYQIRGEYWLNLSVNVISSSSKSQLELLQSATLTYTVERESISFSRGGGNKTKSVLSEGDIFKLRISQEGIHKLTGSYLENELNVNLSSVDVNQIQVFSNPGGMLPEVVGTDRIDDLEELPILVMDGGDGTFSSSDQIIFYAHGADKIYFDEDDQVYRKEENIYDHNNYVFLRINLTEGKRIQTNPSFTSSRYKNSFTAIESIGEDKVNLLGLSLSHQGSGKLWVSENLSGSRNYDIADEMTLTSVVEGSEARIECSFYGRCEESHRVELALAGRNISKTISRIDKDPESTYARNAFFSETFTISGSKPQIELFYPNTTLESDGWLDYATINYRKELIFKGSPLIVRDTFNSSDGGYRLNSTATVQVWDISDIHGTKAESISEVAGEKIWGFEASGQKTFVVFDPGNITLQPIAEGRIDNQNLHAISDVDMVMLYHPEFAEQANRLAAHRSSQSNLNIEMVNVLDVYNEFSSGRQDPTAIRDLLKMIYDRSSDLKYVCLFGDGSYDYRHLVKSHENQSFIPVYETDISLDPIEAFPSDDYFALLDDGEAVRLRGGLDIAVGRILCRDKAEARIMVDKIIRYETSPQSMGDWRNKLVYLADDEDGNQHLRDIERVAKMTLDSAPVFDQDKIYFDAYEQVSTPGGNRFPDANAAINNSVFKGHLSMVYLGHGGPTGLAQERVLQDVDIKEWSNFYNMPVIITATCSFTAFDEPSLTTAGELSVLNQNGGAIAILSTVRAVFAGQNATLTRNVHDFLYERVNGKPMGIGEVMRLAKNKTGTTGDVSNQRKFATFGDPSMALSIPKHRVEVTKINDVDISSFKDTLASLDKVKISGEVTSQSGQLLSGFNGTVSVTVFDKVIQLTTKGTDRRSLVQDFDLRKNILFKGSASVKNGMFDATFVIPKDINFNIGTGKISLYASDGVSEDGHGYFDGLFIGGSSKNGVSDDQGPEIELYMNDENFVFGGITGKDPIMLVLLKDDFGINVVGNSIGHDLTAVLDNNTQNSFILNDFYEAKLDDHTEGSVRYPLDDLENGRHSIKVTAWDIANNFSEAYTEFVVADDLKSSLEHVLNYPNPFTTSTEFQFEHNLPPGQLEVLIHIFTVSGKLVRTLTHTAFSDGYRVSGIQWNGNDEFEHPLAKGVYLYKIMVKADVQGTEIKKESDFERLVVLK